LLSIGGITLFLSQGGVINGARFLPSFLPTFSADLFPTVATYAVSFYLILNGIPRDVKVAKYYKSGMAREVRTSKLASIIQTIEQQRLYAQPGFSLEQLSQTCSLSKHQLSQVINEEMGCTFFELINTYRIRDAKKMLVGSESHLKMEQLAYDLGYRSKSTFFTAFKKATNQTPQKFRQMQSN
jgi:AraC-like DNA-binding protein